MKHKVLILGTLGEFTELVQKAKKRGYEVVVCDGYPDGIARKYADKDYTIPVTDIDSIAQMCREEKIDGIIFRFAFRMYGKDRGKGRAALLSET